MKCLEAARNLNEKVQRSKAKNSRQLMKSIASTKNAKDPITTNTLRFMTHNLRPYHVLDLKHTIKERYESLSHHFKASEDKIIETCTGKIKNGSRVGVISNKGLVKKALDRAKEKGKRFSISKPDDPENDIILTECEAVTPRGVAIKGLNKSWHGRIFVLCNSYKFTNEEMKAADGDSICAIISELGVCKHSTFMHELKRHQVIS